MKTEIILKEGYPFIFTSGAFFVLSLLFYFNASIQVFLFAVFLFFLYFFRNPERIPEDESKYAIISPSDGEVVEIIEEKAPLTNESMIKISIKLSLFDVHVQRSPIEGEIVSKQYIHGLFLNISSDKASELNEQHRVLFKTNKACVVVNQIAGFIIRRIVDFGLFGRVKLGERYGMIMFGSQVDLYVPKNTKIKVTEFQKVKSGETLLGFVNEN